MSFARLPLLAVGAAAVASAALFLDWFTFTVADSWATFVPVQQPDPSSSGWQSAGWPLSASVVMMLLTALTWCAMAGLGRNPTAIRGAARTAAVASFVASGFILARLLDRPELGIGAASHNVAPQPVVFVALVACLLVCAASTNGAGKSFRRFRRGVRVAPR